MVETRNRKNENTSAADPAIMTTEENIDEPSQPANLDDTSLLRQIAASNAKLLAEVDLLCTEVKDLQDSVIAELRKGNVNLKETLAEMENVNSALVMRIDSQRKEMNSLEKSHWELAQHSCRNNIELLESQIILETMLWKIK